MLILAPAQSNGWRPMPRLAAAEDLRMTKGGKLIEGIFTGETINTPSMLCVETISTRFSGRSRSVASRV